MDTTILLALAILLSSSVVLSQGMDKRYKEIPQLGEEAILECSVDDNMASFGHWVLPDIATIDKNYVNGSIPFHYLSENYNLVISHTSFNHLGRYLCYRSIPPHYSEITLQLPGLWDTYQTNVIIGCSAAAVVAIFFSVSCLVYHMRYEQKDPYEEQINEGFVNQGYGNQHFEKGSPAMDRYNKVDIPEDDGVTKM